MSVKMETIELDSILDECLERMQRGEELESCLASYPDHGKELRGLLIAATDVSKLELPQTSRQATEIGRQQMFAALNNKKLTNLQEIQTIPVSIVGILRYLEQVQATIKSNLSKEFLVMHKTVIAIVLVLVMLFGGSAASAYAAQGSLPGDVLYPMKIAIEDVSVDFSIDSASEVRLYLGLAEKRIAEIESLAAEGRYEDMAMAVERFESHIEKAIKGLLIVAQGNPAEAESLATTLGELMKRHAQVLLILMATAPDNVQAAFEDAVEASQEGISAAGEIAGEETAANENGSPEEGEEQDNGNLNGVGDEAEEENENLNGNEEDGNENGDDDEGENTNGDDDDEEENTNGDDDDEGENTNGDDDDEDENTNGDDDDEDENTNGDDDEDDENTNGDDDEDENTNGDDEDENTNGDDDEDGNTNGEEEANENGDTSEDEDGMNENGDDSSEDSSDDANDNTSVDDPSGDSEDNSNESGDEEANENGDSSEDEESSDEGDESRNENDSGEEESNDNDNSDPEEEESENDNSEEDENSNS